MSAPQQPHPGSTAWRRCPVCHERVDWMRRWGLRDWTSRRWKCPKCHSLLQMDAGSELWVFLGIFVAILLPLPFLLTRRRIEPWLMMLACAVIALFLPAPFERVRLVQCAEHHCPSCRYNLTGTLAAGIDRCPECGCRVHASKRLSRDDSLV